MTWKRVLCIYPYAPHKKSEQLYSGTAIINPIGLEVVATAAVRHAEVMLVDLRREMEPLERLITLFRPDLILVSMNWGRDSFVDQVVRQLPPDVTLMIGGIHPTRYPEEYLEAYPQLDLLQIGYGEKAVTELLTRGSPEGVDGLWYRNRPKAYAPGERRGETMTADSCAVIQNACRFDVDVANFHINRSLRRSTYQFFNLKGDNIVTSIGCPMACAFCGWRTNIYSDKQKWLPRTAEDVVAEIAETDAEVVHIVDANFAHDAQRVEKICDLLIKYDIRRLLCCEIRVNALERSAALVRKMEQAGFFFFAIGLESADDMILKRLRKGYTVTMSRRAFANLAKTHILTLGNFLIGIPGQTMQDMLYVADYARELGLDLISPNKIYAYPGSKFHEWVLQHPGYRIEGRRHYVVSDSIGLTAIREIQRKIFFRFLSPLHAWRIYHKALTHPMVLKIGRERVRAALWRTLFNQVTTPRFRRRTTRKILGRFK